MHASLSSHAVPFSLFVGIGHPDAGLHVPAVLHGLLVVHVTGVPPPHAPTVQILPVMHASASVHGVSFGLFVGAGHPDAGLHVPAVMHGLFVVHVTAVPPPHVPLAWQVSPVVQALPSVHVGLPVLGEQIPAVAALQTKHWSVHAVLQQTLLTQDPLAHWVPVVQAIPVDGS